MMATEHETKRAVRLGLLAAAAGAVLGAAAGCQNDRPHQDIHGETFPPDADVRPVDRFADVQSAAAARSDATLTAYHFDGGGGLNSLGRGKLDLMLRDDDASAPLVVYLDVRGPRQSPDGHEDAVRRYLVDRGVRESQMEFRTGPNLDYTRPARDGLRGLRRLEGKSDGATADNGGGAPAGLTNTLTASPGK